MLDTCTNKREKKQLAWTCGVCTTHTKTAVRRTQTWSYSIRGSTKLRQDNKKLFENKKSGERHRIHVSTTNNGSQFYGFVPVEVNNT